MTLTSTLISSFSGSFGGNLNFILSVAIFISGVTFSTQFDLLAIHLKLRKDIRVLSLGSMHRTLKGSTARLDAAKELFKSIGGELNAFYLAMGRYDAGVIGKGPIDENAMKWAMTFT